MTRRSDVAKYQKKPVVIEAFQMTFDRRWNSLEWPEWLYSAWNLGDGSYGSLEIDSDDPAKELLVIVTLEGPLRIAWDDWVIQGVKGELYPCKPDIFEATYERGDV